MRLANSKFARHPQSLRFRRALFQIHLWTGIASALYILLISLSGSAIVLRREMDHAFCPRIILVKPSGPRLTDAQLVAAARRSARPPVSPANMQVEIRGSRVPGAAVEIWYVFQGVRFERLFEPYTGKDLGEAVACEPKLVTRLADLHDDLLVRGAGRTANGVGAAVVLVILVTGAVIWWPGKSRWRQSLTLRLNVNWRRFIWNLHSVLGFWTFALLLVWAISGVYFAFPSAFSAAIDSIFPPGAGRDTSPTTDALIDWLVRLHFGRAFGLSIKVLWLILGLVPSGLTVTGVLMWWSRVVRKATSPS